MSTAQFQEGELSPRTLSADAAVFLDSDDDDSQEEDVYPNRGTEFTRRLRSADEVGNHQGEGIRSSTIRESIIKQAIGRLTLAGTRNGGNSSPIKETQRQLTPREGEGGGGGGGGGEGVGDLFQETNQVNRPYQFITTDIILLYHLIIKALIVIDFMTCPQVSAETYRDSMNTVLRGQRNTDKAPAFITLTILSDGMRHYGNMTLRELTALVQAAIEAECGENAAIPEEFLAVSKIKYRDVRRMESILSAHEEPAILVRYHAVFMLLDPVRAVVLSDRMIVVVPDGADNMIGLLLSIFDVSIQCIACEYSFIKKLLSPLVLSFRTNESMSSPTQHRRPRRHSHL
jgi:hypothetical protein